MYMPNSESPPFPSPAGSSFPERNEIEASGTTVPCNGNTTLYGLRMSRFSHVDMIIII